MKELRECIRCEKEFYGGHAYCSECRARYEKETPEEKERWKRLAKALSQARYRTQHAGDIRKQRVEKGIIWSSRIRNWKSMGIIDPPETREDWERMVEATGGVCPACGRRVSGKRAAGWQLHHDHKIGRVIGLICRACNMGMGQFGDDPDTVMRVAIWMVDREMEMKLDKDFLLV